MACTYSFIYCHIDLLDLDSFPTRRSSDLRRRGEARPWRGGCRVLALRRRVPRPSRRARRPRLPALDRKSTRLNSSHLVISYAVFCLKKKSAKTNMLVLTASASSL